MAENTLKATVDMDNSGYVEGAREVEGATERMQEAADEAGEKARKSGQDAEKAGASLKSLGDSAAKAGAALTLGVTTPLSMAGKSAFQTAADFESSMSRVSGALDDPSANMEELRDLALEMGASTIFSATESGAAMEELAKGGLTAADIKGGALATTMDLAAAGNLQLADAANTVVQAMGAFGLTADDTTQAANALAGAAAASSADVSDLTQGLSQVSAQANSAGWSIQDTTAVLAGFADAGIKGSDAGTSLKTMLQRLAAPTDEAAEVMASLGINARDSNGNMKDAAGIAEELQGKLGGLSSAEKDAAMQTLFGSDASRAALVMTNLGRQGVEKYTAATNDQTAAQRLADAQMGDSERAMEEMKGAVETAAIAVGEALAPVVVEVAGAVGDAAEAFSELDEDTQKMIVTAAAAVAAAGPVLTVVGKGASLVGSLSGALGTAGPLLAGLGTSAGDARPKIGDAAAAAGDLAAGIDATGTKAGGASGKLAGYARNAGILAAAAFVAAEGTKAFFTSHADSEGRFEGYAQSAYDYAAALGTVDANADGVVDSSDLMAQALDGAGTALEDGNRILSTFPETLHGIRESSEGVGGAIRGFFGATEDDVAYAMERIAALATSGWGSALAATVATGGEIAEETRNAALGMVDAMNGLPEEYSSYGDEAMRALAASMAPYWPELADYSAMSAMEIGSVIKSKLGESLEGADGGFQLSGETAIDQLASGLRAAANGEELGAAATDTVAQLLDSFRTGNLPEGMEEAGTESMRKLAAGLEDQWPELSACAAMSGDEIIDALADKLGISYDEGVGYGEDYGYGYAAGMTSDAVLRAVAASGAQLVGEAMASVQTTQNSNSPAKESMRLGGDFGEGYGLGIDSEQAYVEGHGRSLVRAALSGVGELPLESAFASAIGSGSSLGNVSYSIPSGFDVSGGSGGSPVVHNHYSIGNIDYTGDAQVERCVLNLFETLERRAHT